MFVFGIYLIVSPDTSNIVSVGKENMVVVIDTTKRNSFPVNKLIGSIFVLSATVFALYFLKKNSKTNREKLTTQEQKIYELIKAKYSNKEIAAELYISISTVKTHVNNIYKKLGISSRKQIVDN